MFWGAWGFFAVKVITTSSSKSCETQFFFSISLFYHCRHFFRNFWDTFLFRNRKLSFLHSLCDKIHLKYNLQHERNELNLWDENSLGSWFERRLFTFLFTVLYDFTSSYIAPCFPPLPFWCGLIMVWVLIHEWRLEIPSRIPWASSFVSFPPDVLFFVPRFFSFTCECIQKRICKQSNKGGSRRESQTCKNLSWKTIFTGSQLNEKTYRGFAR